MAERDGVSVTTLAANFIDGWAQPPLFVGGQGDSAENLAGVMEDIRWNGAPNPVTIDIEGLDPGAAYEVQLLVNEGRDRLRQWDIGIGQDPDNLELIVDNFTSRGEEEPVTNWTDENSFLWVGELTATEGGSINIAMQQQIGGLNPAGDNNPILQGVVVHRAGPGVAFEITAIARSASEITLQWNSAPGREYAVEFNTSLIEPIWIELDDGVQSEGATTEFTDDDPDRLNLAEGYYRVRQN